MTRARADDRSVAMRDADRREHLDSFVTALLSASRALVGVSARSLAELDESVTLPQFRTLVILTSQGETNLNRLAELLGVNASSALRMIDRLIAAELVVREENAANRREVRLLVTPLGRDMVRKVVSRRRREITRIVRRMPEELSEDLILALNAFAAAAEGSDHTAANDVSELGW